MATKDITDLQVCQAYAEWTEKREQMVDSLLMRATGQPEKVVYRAMERADRRGYIDYGVSLRSGWLTDKGRELVAANQS
jgi:hypothetical protein